MSGLLFSSAPGQQPLPGEIRRDAELSADGACRFTLSRFWREGPHVLFTGVNPATANGLRDDMTVRRWIWFAAAWGYAGFVAVNPVPFISASQSEAAAWLAAGRDALGTTRSDIDDANNNAIVGEAARAARIVVCHGVAPWAEQEIRGMVALLRLMQPALYCMGTNADGSPRHPMARGRHRVPDNQQPEPWPAAA